jgi:hypothetical protein
MGVGGTEETEKRRNGEAEKRGSREAMKSSKLKGKVGLLYHLLFLNILHPFQALDPLMVHRRALYSKRGKVPWGTSSSLMVT